MKRFSSSVICGLLLLSSLPAMAQFESEPMDPVINEQEFTSFEEGSPESEFLAPMTDEGASPEIERQEDIIYPDDPGASWDLESEEMPEAEYTE